MVLIYIRRLVQFLFFALFVLIFLRTTLHGENDTEPWATFFFDIDPLVLLSTWLASGSVLPKMFLALIVVAFTLLLGRLFCGWICPLGTLFNFISACRKARLAHWIQTGTWNRWQKAKYLLLIGLLVSSLCGLHLAGIFDPLPFLYRTFTTSIYPAFNWGADELFTWLYENDPGIGPVRVTVVSEPIYSFLRDYVLTRNPKPYDGGVLIGLLFVLVAIFALMRFRFWCRYICPLGALLGLCSKTARVELHNDIEKCDHCKLCVAYCHGACDPHLAGEWKKDECLQCFNCRRQCPNGAIGFRWSWFGRSVEIIHPLPPKKSKQIKKDEQESEA
ncbi:MAG TPA: 4Fe-4S binding protein [bacterium]|nr:4Fe-4S binding protein [bacterium]